MTNRRKTLPPLPAKAPAELRPLIAAMAEILETGEGVRGNPLDRKLTLRDILDSGIAKLKPGARPGTPGGLDSGYKPPAPDRSVPPAPTGFSADGSFFGLITLTWDNPAQLYANHAHANIYRSSEDNFANAELVGRDPGMFYSDRVRNDVQVGDQIPGYYYWLTLTSETGVEGPPHSPNGAFARPQQDVRYLLETLSRNLEDEPVDLGAPDETLILNAKRLAVKVGAGEAAVFPLVIADIAGVPTVVLDTAIIRDASIQEGKLGPITTGKLFLPDGTPVTTVGGLIKADALAVDQIQIGFGQVSGDLGSTALANNGRPVWLFRRNGGFEMNSTGPDGGRVERDGSGDRVYDENGRLRVRMGYLG